MKLTIFSDIHDNVWNLQKALAMPAVQRTEALLCCGDLCAPFIITLLGRAYSKEIHIVLGNNDGDVVSILHKAKELPHVHIHGEYFRGDFGGKTFAMTHYPEKAESIAKSQTYDVVCYGHNHNLNKGEQVGKSLLINPGAVMGYNGGALKDIPATLLLLDTETMEVQVYEIKG